MFKLININFSKVFNAIITLSGLVISIWAILETKSVNKRQIEFEKAQEKENYLLNSINYQPKLNISLDHKDRRTPNKVIKYILKTKHGAIGPKYRYELNSKLNYYNQSNIDAFIEFQLFFDSLDNQQILRNVVYTLGNDSTIPIANKNPNDKFFKKIQIRARESYSENIDLKFKPDSGVVHCFVLYKNNLSYFYDAYLMVKYRFTKDNCGRSVIETSESLFDSKIYTKDEAEKLVIALSNFDHRIKNQNLKKK